MKNIFILIKRTIFPFDILFIVAPDKEVFRYIERKKNYTLNDEEREKLIIRGTGRTVRLRGGQVVMRLVPAKTKIGIDLSDLVHEISHAVFFVLDHVGVKITDDSDEVFAYYQAYVIREILTILDKRPKRKDHENKKKKS